MNVRSCDSSPMTLAEAAKLDPDTHAVIVTNVALALRLDDGDAFPGLQVPVAGLLER